jgi:hypothetical protein
MQSRYYTNCVDCRRRAAMVVGLGRIVADNPTTHSDNPVSEATIVHFVWKIPSEPPAPGYMYSSTKLSTSNALHVLLLNLVVHF